MGFFMERGVLKISYQREIVMSTCFKNAQNRGLGQTSGGPGEVDPRAVDQEGEPDRVIQAVRSGVPAVLF